MIRRPPRSTRTDTLFPYTTLFRLMAANYNRPKPIDPIAYRRGCYLNIRCKCGHAVSVQLGKFAQDNGIPERTQAYQLIKRLRCSRCSCRPSSADVTRYRGSNRSEERRVGTECVSTCKSR